MTSDPKDLTRATPDLRDLCGRLVSKWPHRLALLLCCATFPLVWVGGLVTTYQAGMAVPDWPNTYGYNLFLYPISTWLLGPWDLFIEHGHRLFAALVGMLTIALCISVFVTAQPRWLRMLALFALAGVIFQGALGGMRVLFDARRLAMTHGCIGPAFFAFTAALAVWTSRWWREGRGAGQVNGTRGLRILALALPAVAYLQIVLGAHLRHISPEQTYSVFQMYVVSHIAVAVGLTAQILITAYMVWRRAPRVEQLMIPAGLLVALVAEQLGLGAATWIVNFGWPAFLAGSGSAAGYTVQAHGWWQAQITTAHVAIGSLMLAVSTVLAVSSVRMVDVRSVVLSRVGSLQEVAA